MIKTSTMQPQMLSYNKLVLSACKKGIDHRIAVVMLSDIFGIRTQTSSVKYFSNKAEQQKLSTSQSYQLLGVAPDCTEEELRDAYLEKVKHYHPDQSTDSANSAKFIEVQQAYKSAMDHRKGQAILDEMENRESEFEHIKHTAPQHRRFLSHEGVGFGSQSARQQQFNQIRVVRASESVYEHRQKKIGSDETAVVTKDKKEARKIKISNLIERVVDDMIRESMQKGEFENLSGQGKPLDYSDHNPLVDTTTHNLNKIMVNNGFKPEWIMLSKEIRDGVHTARERLAIARERLGPPPYSEAAEVKWRHETHMFKVNLDEINTQINKFNMIVPFMEKQMVHYEWQRNVEKVLERHKDFLPSEENMKHMYTYGGGAGGSHFSRTEEVGDLSVDWKLLWEDIKGVFRVKDR